VYTRNKKEEVTKMRRGAGILLSCVLNGTSSFFHPLSITSSRTSITPSLHNHNHHDHHHGSNNYSNNESPVRSIGQRHHDRRKWSSKLDAFKMSSVEEMQRRKLSTDTDDDEGNPLFDVLICGAGPGGLLLASNLAKEGCHVGIVDPVLDKPWPNNYGVWMDEAEPFG